MAAIGSNVRLATSNPAADTAEYSPSTTSSGRKVTIRSSAIFLTLCPKMEFMGSSLAKYCTVL